MRHMNRPLPSQTIPSAIRAELARRLIPHRDLAAALGMSPAMLAERMHGRIPLTVDDVDAAARFLGVSVATLFGDELFWEDHVREVLQTLDGPAR